MEKLELKHWTALLPHNMLCQIQVDGKDQDEILKGIEITDNGFVLFFGEFGEWNPDEVYPYLHPLSDLPKEIKHNDDRCTLLDMINITEYRCNPTEDGRYPQRKGYYFRKSNVWYTVPLLPYWKVEKLLEWHVDVFELIPKGLAIKKK